MDRIERCKKNYTELFGGEALTGQGTDPEMMDILQKFIFGEVFRTGDLDKKTRELITCTILATMQTLPQLNAHAKAGAKRRRQLPSSYGSDIPYALRLSVSRRH